MKKKVNPSSEEFLKAIREGFTITEAVKKVGIHRKTPYTWRYQDPEGFGKLWDQAYEIGCNPYNQNAPIAEGRVQQSVCFPPYIIKRLDAELKAENKNLGLIYHATRGAKKGKSKSDLIIALIWQWLINGDVRTLVRLAWKGGFPGQDEPKLTTRSKRRSSK